MNPIIRPLAQEDLEELLAIERKSFSDPWTLRMFLSEIECRGYNYARVAIRENPKIIVGYCIFWIVPEDEVQISNIAVHPDMRRQGIARQLIENAVEEGRNRKVCSVSLEVRESNSPARAFYKTLGFVEVGRRVRYYRNPVEDALILRWKFED